MRVLPAGIEDIASALKVKLRVMVFCVHMSNIQHHYMKAITLSEFALSWLITLASMPGQNISTYWFNWLIHYWIQCTPFKTLQHVTKWTCSSGQVFRLHCKLLPQWSGSLPFTLQTTYCNTVISGEGGGRVNNIHYHFLLSVYDKIINCFYICSCSLKLTVGLCIRNSEITFQPNDFQSVNN